MSSTIQKVEIDGQSVWVEISDIAVVSAAKQADDNRFVSTSASSKVSEAIEEIDVASTLKAIISPARKAMDTFKPDEVNIELTLGFKAGVGCFVTSGEANAQIKISAKWKLSE